MINIMTTYDDNSTLDFLATECEYEVEIRIIDGATNSVICENGEQVLELIDRELLLADNLDPFPTISNAITYLNPLINSIGL